MSIPTQFHDEEIMGISFDKENLVLTITLDPSGLFVLENIEYFEFSSFDFQNIIFEINKYSGKDLPGIIIDEYPWVDGYLKDEDFKYCVITPSTGLGGLIVYQ